jgi:L-ascorbate metabolism protein UlaG (beta-lactamase superfamily)
MHNPDLKTIPPSPDWQGTPVDKSGRFRNLDSPFIPKLSDVIRWKLQHNPFKAEKEAENWEPALRSNIGWLANNNDVIVRLGHSTFFIRLDGISLLTDPVFGDILSVKRRTPFPFYPPLLKKLDYILLSHDHRDHMDKPSLALLARNNPNAQYLAGLGMKPLIRRFTGSTAIQEAGWYQQYNASLKITFVPARHWSRRGLFDPNKRLWGGFVIEGNNKRIFFGGDSGYDVHFNTIGNTFGGFDYAILGIGAYQPEWFMHPAHQSPADALRAMDDLQAKHMIPMHYGTFDLSDEPMGMPVHELLRTATDSQVANKIIVLDTGQPLNL